MRKSLAALALGAIVTYASPSVAADTHVIKSDSTPAWTSDGKAPSKTDGTPLVIDDLKIGDIIDIQIASGFPQHGVIAIKQLANVPPAQNEIRDPVTNPVWACGQAKSDAAVLREIECGAASKFGVKYAGSMKLEVMDTFKGDINFWCVVHHFMMTGTLKLKP
jgi:hypothetical protein